MESVDIDRQRRHGDSRTRELFVGRECPLCHQTVDPIPDWRVWGGALAAAVVLGLGCYLLGRVG